MGTRGEGGRYISIRRGRVDLGKVVRLVFSGEELKKETRFENASGFVNFHGRVHAVYSNRDESLFLDLENLPVDALLLRRKHPERY